MNIKFGKHCGMSVEFLVLKAPDYAMWLLSQKAISHSFFDAQQKIRRLIRAFDQRPFIKRCQGTGCRKRATRCSVHQGSTQLLSWCDECDPYELGASPGKLHAIEKYFDVVNYVSMFCNGRKAAMEMLVRELARAKGLPKRVGEDEAIAFFS
jgi:hypothetical protein